MPFVFLFLKDPIRNSLLRDSQYNQPSLFTTPSTPRISILTIAGHNTGQRFGQEEVKGQGTVVKGKGTRDREKKRGHGTEKRKGDKGHRKGKEQRQ